MNKRERAAIERLANAVWGSPDFHEALADVIALAETEESK